MKLKIAFAGDVCLVERAATTGAARAVSIQTCAQLTGGHDLAIANLEFCIAPDDAQNAGSMAVQASDCSDLAQAGFDVYCLANNHILDCGSESLLFTTRFLNSQSIATVGVAANSKDAAAPLILERSGVRIAVINATDASHYAARANHPGVFSLSRRRLKRALNRVQSSVDLTIVCIHADLEFTNHPAPWKVALSRWLVQCGADLVIHHHPHTLQGIEEFQGALIAYSLGNLVFPVHGSDYMQSRAGDVHEGALLSVTIEFATDSRRRIAYSLYPTVIRHDNATVMAEAQQAEEIRAKMAAYSSCLNDAALLRRTHFRRCRAEAAHLILSAYYSLRKAGLAACVRVLNTHVRTQMHRAWMRGFLTMGWR